MVDVCYHDKFKLIGSDKKAPNPKGPKAAAAATSPHIDKQGKEWNNTYEWLASFNIKSVKKRWQLSLSGIDFCPICHQDKDKHAPAACPLLAELNLKRTRISPPTGFLAMAPAPAASPSPGGRSAVVNGASALGLAGPSTAPSSLVATLVEEFDSDDNFCWDGDESGAEFGDSFITCKSNNDVASYPSCKHVAVEAILPVSVCLVPAVTFDHDTFTILPLVLSSCCIKLSKKLMSLIASMSASLNLPGSYC